MRILYLSLSYVPSRRASSVQVMKMCAAFARRGHDVTLVAKQGESSSDGDHALYGVESSFAVVKLPRPAWRGGGIVYGAGLLSRIAGSRADLVFSRDPIGAFAATEVGMRVAFEAHEIPAARWLRAMMRRTARKLAGTVAITQALREDLIAASLANPTRPIVVAHDAYDTPTSAVVARSLGSPPVIGYVGSLYRGRGIELIVELARRLPACRFRLIGGSEKDLAMWRAEGLPPNVELLGFRPQAELPSLYRQLDIVLMPHASHGVVGATGTDISRWTSPMKMFEYMASGVPLIASDLPVLQEVLSDGRNALIAPANEVDAWVAAIERLLVDPTLRHQLARTAQGDIERKYTWDRRAENVLRGLGVE